MLLAVPRHPEQFSAFKKICQENAVEYVSRSDQVAPSGCTQVIIGDTMGELLLFYGTADIAFVGGSLIDRGGHNPLEPVACGVPVVMGRHSYNFLEVCNKLRETKILTEVDDGDALFQVVGDLLERAGLRQRISHRCKTLMKNNQGTVERLMADITRLLG